MNTEENTPNLYVESFELVRVTCHQPHLAVEISRILTVLPDVNVTDISNTYAIVPMQTHMVNPTNLESLMYNGTDTFPHLCFLVLVLSNDRIIMARSLSDIPVFWDPSVPVMHIHSHSSQSFPLFNLIHESLHQDRSCVKLLKWVEGEREKHLETVMYLDELRAYILQE